MNTLSTLTAALAIAFALATSGCAAEDACVGDQCDEETGSLFGGPTLPTSELGPDPDLSLDCHRACAQLVGTCASTGTLTNDERTAWRGCSQSCIAGQLAVDEVECLASLTCGQASNPCFE